MASGIVVVKDGYRIEGPLYKGCAKLVTNVSTRGAGNWSLIHDSHHLTKQVKMRAASVTSLLTKCHFNRQGWVPRSELGLDVGDLPEKIFHPGQVLKCQVLTCQPQEQKLRLTLKVSFRTRIGGMVSSKRFDYGNLAWCHLPLRSKLSQRKPSKLGPPMIEAIVVLIAN